jgi:hypothetical protein
MKKISIFIMAAASVAAFTSCTAIKDTSRLQNNGSGRLLVVQRLQANPNIPGTVAFAWPGTTEKQDIAWNMEVLPLKTVSPLQQPMHLSTALTGSKTGYGMRSPAIKAFAAEKLLIVRPSFGKVAAIPNNPVKAGSTSSMPDDLKVCLLFLGFTLVFAILGFVFVHMALLLLITGILLLLSLAGFLIFLGFYLNKKRLEKKP